MAQPSPPQPDSGPSQQPPIDRLNRRARAGGRVALWALIGAGVGIVAGLSSSLFLVSLDLVVAAWLRYPWLLFGLPLFGLAVGLAYHHLGGRSGEGNNLILDQIHSPTDWIPTRMAPLVLIGTLLTHLGGGSAGREGTALQMAGALTDGLSRVFRVSPETRRRLLVAALAGGFGSIFGVPVAGAVFALEVQTIGRIRYDALVPALCASVVGDQVVRAFGILHAAEPTVPRPQASVGLLCAVLVAGCCFGLAGAVFSEATHAIKRLAARWVAYPPLRPFLGGLVVIGLTFAFGTRAYNGLSLALMHDAVFTGNVATFAFACKLVLTAVTLGWGFQGGEVTPLFVIGATLGATLGHLFGVSPTLMAALGFVAVFAGAANVPLACTIMGIELFGSGPVVYLAIACVAAYICSAHTGIYGGQRIGFSKDGSDAGDRRLVPLPNAPAVPGAGPNAPAVPGAGPNAPAVPGAGPNAPAVPGAGPNAPAVPDLPDDAGPPA